MELLAVSVKDAARALGVGRTTVYALVNEGKIETIHVGRRRLIKTASLRRLIASEVPE
jgi:excisionase family DNA binding protein